MSVSLCSVYPDFPEVDDAEILQYGTDNVLVVIQWSHQSIVSYNVNTIPQVLNATFIERTRIQMLVFYNTLYNVSITATLCGQNNATTIVMLNYGRFNIC